MITNQKILLDNLRAFKTLADGAHWGITLRDSLLILEEECENPSLKPKFGKLVESILQREGGNLDEDWASNYFLKSTKELFTLGLKVSPLDFFMNPATDLIRIKLRYEQGLVKGCELEVCDFYLLTLLQSSLTLSLALKCLTEEIPSLVSELNSQELSNQSLSFGELVNSHDVFCSPEVTTMFSSLKLNEWLQGSKDVEPLLLKRKHALSKLLSFKDFHLNKTDQRALFYRAISQALKSGKYINEIFEPGFEKITETNFRQNWEKISEDLLVDPQLGLESLENSTLSMREKVYFRTGFNLGSLDSVLDGLAESIETPY